MKSQKQTTAVSKKARLPRSEAGIGSRSLEQTTVTLDPTAAELLRWACEKFGRRPDDIVNAALRHLETPKKEEGEAHSEQCLYWHEEIAEVATIRIAREEAQTNREETHLCQVK